MMFLFGNHALWPFLFLLAVPLLLHLFARSRPPVYLFSSIEFIRRIIRSTLRIKRPKDWLLLLIRTLIFTAVILLFLQPVFFARRALADPFQKKNVVLIVDATASMAYPDGAQTRFASACAEASEILSGLSSRDTANIIWIQAIPEPVFPEMGVNFSFLQDALQHRAVTLEAGAIDKALSLAVSLLERQEGRREICVLSDFQKSAWEPVRAELPPGLDLIKIKIGSGEGANQALADMRLDPPRPLAGEDAIIYCEVWNYSPQPMRKTVFLSVGESRLSQDVMVPAWNKAVAVFKHRFGDPGIFPLAAHLAEDAFPSDDRRVAVAEVHEFLRAGILPLEPLTAAAWRRALQATGWVKADGLTPANPAGDPSLDVIWLSGWDGAGDQPLRQSLQAGCAIICYPAPNLPVSRIAALINGADRRSGDRFRWEQGGAAHTLQVKREKDDLFRIFTGGEFGDFSRAAFRGRFVFSAAALPPGDLLLAYDDNVPALMRFSSGQGLLYLWNLPLNPELSNWPKRADFLPFLAELMLVSRRGAGADQSVIQITTGEDAAWSLDHDVPRSELALRGEDGQLVPLRELRGSSRMTLVTGQSLNPGLYTWQHMDKSLAWTIVTFPSIESDLRVLPSAELASGNAGTGFISRGHAIRQLHEGISLWPYLLVLGLLLAMAEGLSVLWAQRP